MGGQSRGPSVRGEPRGEEAVFAGTSKKSRALEGGGEEGRCKELGG